MSLNTTRPAVVTTTMPGLYSFSPSPLSRRLAGSRSLIGACRPIFPWLWARKTSLGDENVMPSPGSPARWAVR